jgi:spermidine synthase
MKISFPRLLPTLVFITGAAVLIVEVVALRVLSPFFGNTLYSVSSVLSVILGALAIGYFHAGILAKRHATFLFFFSIIGAGGAAVGVLLFFAKVLLPPLSTTLSVEIGPLIASLILFAPPSYLLALLSPIGVKLFSQTNASPDAGSAAGRMFFYSTLGSIFGSLLAGFVLVPFIGTTLSLILVSAILLVIGCAGILLAKGAARFKKYYLSAVLVLITGSVLFISIRTPAYAAYPGRIVYQTDGTYEELTVVDGSVFGKPARILLLDRSTSSGIFLPSGDLAFPYTEYYQMANLLPAPPKNALVIGGGTFTIPRMLEDTFKDATITVTEIEPKLLPLAEQYFGLSDMSRIVPITADGRQYLKSTDEKFDFIFGDAYSSLFSLPWQLTTKEYYALVKSHLSKHGMYVSNMIGSLSAQGPSILYSNIHTMETAFPYVSAFAVDDTAKITPQNVMLVGSDEPLPARAPANVFLDTVLTEHHVNLNRIDLSNYPIITDDLAPTELMTAKLLTMGGISNTAVNGDEALATIKNETALGPRYPGSDGYLKVQSLIEANLTSNHVPFAKDTFTAPDDNGTSRTLTNIIGRINPAATNRIIIGTHYDTKRYAERDLHDPTQAPLAANNGGSGTALLLELSRVLPHTVPASLGIDLVFFDGEEGNEDVNTSDGESNGWVPLGSTHFAADLAKWYPNKEPKAAIILDMVCDKNLSIYKEKNSEANASILNDGFFALANNEYPNVFFDSEKYAVSDDHTSLAAKGVPSILLIDFDYPYLNTMKDTIDKCSAQSLGEVGTAIVNFLNILPVF